MAVITLRVTDEQKEAWVESAGGTQKLSAWIRDRCDAPTPVPVRGTPVAPQPRPGSAGKRFTGPDPKKR